MEQLVFRISCPICDLLNFTMSLVLSIEHPLMFAVHWVPSGAHNLKESLFMHSLQMKECHEGMVRRFTSKVCL